MSSNHGSLSLTGYAFPKKTSETRQTPQQGQINLGSQKQQNTLFEPHKKRQQRRETIEMIENGQKFEKEE